MKTYKFSYRVFVKLVIFTIFDGQLMIYLDVNNNLPKEELRAEKLPDNVAKEIFQKELSLSFTDFYLEQLYTFSTQKGEGVEIVYFALVPSLGLSSVNRMNWTAWSDLRKKIRDYKIIAYAVQRLQWKIEYTNVVYSLLGTEFTLSELQKVYEAILGRSLDKRNFRRKILSLGLLVNTGKKKKGIIARPAEIYKFKTRTPQIVKVFL